MGKTPMKDWEMLRVVADWFDVYDRKHGTAGNGEVQADLRRIALGLELNQILRKKPTITKAPKRARRKKHGK